MIKEFENDDLQSGIGKKLERFLICYQVKSNRRLHKKLGTRQVAQGSEDDDWVHIALALQSKTLSTALLSKYFRAVVALFASFLIFNAIINAYTAARFFVVRGRYFKFVAKDSLQSECSVDVESAFFRHDARNCEWPHQPRIVSAQGMALVFKFEDSVGITGWSTKQNSCRQANHEVKNSAQRNNTEVNKAPHIHMNLHRSDDGSQWEELMDISEVA